MYVSKTEVGTRLAECQLLIVRPENNLSEFDRLSNFPALSNLPVIVHIPIPFYRMDLNRITLTNRPTDRLTALFFSSCLVPPCPMEEK